MKIEVAVLGSPPLIIPPVSVDVKHHIELNKKISEFRNCVTVEVDVLGSPSLIVLWSL